jgi:hypothetical protein
LLASFFLPGNRANILIREHDAVSQAVAKSVIDQLHGGTGQVVVKLPDDPACQGSLPGDDMQRLKKNLIQRIPFLNFLENMRPEIAGGLFPPLLQAENI